MTGYESSIIFWTRISALGTCLGALATFCAVCVALWQTKYINRKRLKLELSEKTHLLGSMHRQTYLTVKITNIGNRDVQIKSWILKGHKKNGTNGLITPNKVYADGFCELPVKLKCEQQVMLMWEESMFIGAICDFLNKGILNPYNRITFVVEDSVGKKYKIKTKDIAKNYAKS